jgi:hypothetical protein
MLIAYIPWCRWCVQQRRKRRVRSDSGPGGAVRQFKPPGGSPRKFTGQHYRSTIRDRSQLQDRDQRCPELRGLPACHRDGPHGRLRYVLVAPPSTDRRSTVIGWM